MPNDTKNPKISVCPTTLIIFSLEIIMYSKNISTSFCQIKETFYYEENH